MFSEYASKFLQQSQSRIGGIHARTSSQPNAPLFHSAADFLPEDPEQEQDRLDLYALERSRRHFGAYAPSNATGVDEDDEEDAEYSEESTESLRRSRGRRGFLSTGRHTGIRSSWRASRSGTAQGSTAGGSVLDSAHSFGMQQGTSAKGKEKMVDVRLDQSDPDLGDSQLPFVRYDNQRGSRDSMSDDEFATHPPDDILVEMPRDESPPPFQNFHRPPREQSPSLPFAHDPKENTPFMPQEAHRSRPEVPQQAAIPQQVNNPVLQVEPPQHDKVWGSLYILSMAIMFTTSFIVWLHTEEVNIPKKDTIYKALHGSYHLLAISTIVSIGFSMLWMYLLRSFVKPLTYLILVGAPVSMVSFSIYPFVMSFKAPEGGGSYGGQAALMRWGSIAPMIGALYWIFCAWRNRFSMSRATGIIQLGCRIIGDNPALIVLSFSTLVGTVVFSWIWLAMFTRVFLTGNFIVGGQWWWSLNTKTISLGVYYIMMYLWTLGIFSGIHRATSAATVSQWYFHRHTLPRTSSISIVSAALSHSTTTLFGPIALHSLLSLLVRLPILVAPPRIASLLHLFFFQFITSPIASLIDPLTLTYAAVHSIPLLSSSRGASQLRCVDTAGFGPQSHPRPAYRLAKMLLTSARAIAALGMGMAAWIAAARQVNGGSVYGYLVGLMAGSIGWAVIGATEGCLSNVVDATLVCVASEGDRGFCREARAVFGG